MNRRTFIFSNAFGLCAVSLGAFAQPKGKIYRIGILSRNTRMADADFRRWAWVVALRELGWIEGKNVVFVRRASDGNLDILPELSRELVRENVDVIATFSSADALIVKQETSVIPIVMIFGGLDPVREGFVKRFDKPGGNITGVSRMLLETDAKRLELLKEMLPSASVVGVIAHARPDTIEQENFEKRMRAAARSLSVEPKFFSYKDQADVEAAFPAMARMRVRAFLLEPSFFTFNNRGRIADLAIKHHLAGVFTLSEYAEAGGLMAYGPNYTNLLLKHAQYVDRILRGEKPGNLPIEQPTKFDLMINLKTAKALSLKVPQSLLIRAETIS